MTLTLEPKPARIMTREERVIRVRNAIRKHGRCESCDSKRVEIITAHNVRLCADCYLVAP